MLLFLFFIFTLSGVVNSVREIPYITVEKQPNGDELLSMVVTLPVITTTEPDTYMVFSKSLDEIGEGYVLSSTVVADRDIVHHASSAMCEEPFVVGLWNRAITNGKSCKGNSVNFGEWDAYSAENGLQTFPDDVSLKIGAVTKMKYLVTEVHFKNPVKEHKVPPVNVTLNFVKKPTKYNFQIYMMMTDGLIPARKDKGYFAEMACPWKKPPIQAYRYSVHAHHNSYMAEAFLIRNKTWTLLGSHLTQTKAKNQFHIPGGPLEIRTGDILAARCLYVNKGETPIKFGTTDKAEMCNVDLYIGYEAKYEEHFLTTPACMTVLPEFSFCDHEQTNGICY